MGVGGAGRLVRGGGHHQRSDLQLGHLLLRLPARIRRIQGDDVVDRGVSRDVPLRRRSGVEPVAGPFRNEKDHGGGSRDDQRGAGGHLLRRFHRLPGGHLRPVRHRRLPGDHGHDRRRGRLLPPVPVPGDGVDAVGRRRRHHGRRPRAGVDRGDVRVAGFDARPRRNRPADRRMCRARLPAAGRRPAGGDVQFREQREEEEERLQEGAVGRPLPPRPGHLLRVLRPLGGPDGPAQGSGDEPRLPDAVPDGGGRLRRVQHAGSLRVGPGGRPLRSAAAVLRVVGAERVGRRRPRLRPLRVAVRRVRLPAGLRQRSASGAAQPDALPLLRQGDHGPALRLRHLPGGLLRLGNVASPRFPDRRQRQLRRRPGLPGGGILPVRRPGFRRSHGAPQKEGRVHGALRSERTAVTSLPLRTPLSLRPSPPPRTLDVSLASKMSMARLKTRALVTPLPPTLQKKKKETGRTEGTSAT